MESLAGKRGVRASGDGKDRIDATFGRMAAGTELITRSRLHTLYLAFFILFSAGAFIALLVAWKFDYFSQIFGASTRSACQLIGVEETSFGAQWFSIDALKGTRHYVGGADPTIHFSAAAVHPTTGMVYGFGTDGVLYQVGNHAAARTPVRADSVYTGITAAQFDPENTLWAIEDRSRFIRIDTTTGIRRWSEEWDVPNLPVDAFAWSVDRSQIFVTSGASIFAMGGTPGETPRRICSEGVLGNPAVALQVRANGELVALQHTESHDGLRLVRLHPERCTTVAVEYPVPFERAAISAGDCAIPDGTPPVAAIVPQSVPWSAQSITVSVEVDSHESPVYVRHCWSHEPCDPGIGFGTSVTQSLPLVQDADGSWQMCTRVQNVLGVTSDPYCSGSYNIDRTPPVLLALSALDPGPVAEPIVTWTANDPGGAGITRVQVWRRNGSCPHSATPRGWTRVYESVVSGEEQVNGRWTDHAPLTDGTYCYGMHVYDAARNWATEAPSQQIEVIVQKNNTRCSTDSFATSVVCRGTGGSLILTSGKVASLVRARVEQHGTPDSPYIDTFTTFDHGVAELPESFPDGRYRVSLSMPDQPACLLEQEVTLACTGRPGSVLRLLPEERTTLHESLRITLAATQNDRLFDAFRYCWTRSTSCDPGIGAPLIRSAQPIVQTASGVWTLCARALGIDALWDSEPVCSGPHIIDNAPPAVNRVIGVITAGTPEIAWNIHDQGDAGIDRVHIWRRNGSCTTTTPDGWTVASPDMVLSEAPPAHAGSWREPHHLDEGLYCYEIRASDRAGNYSFSGLGARVEVIVRDEGDTQELSPLFSACMTHDGMLQLIDQTPESAAIAQWQWQIGDMDSYERFPKVALSGVDPVGVTLTLTDTAGVRHQYSKAIAPRSVDACQFGIRTATSPSCGTAGIEWSTLSGAEEYRVLRSESLPGPFAAIANIHPRDTVFCSDSACSYTDRPLGNGQEWWYTVQARMGDSFFLNTLPSRSSRCGGDACPLPVFVPECSAPDIHIKSISCGALAVSWREIPASRGYTLYRSLAEKQEFIPIFSGTAREYTDTTIITGQEYMYFIRPYFVDGREGDKTSVASGQSFCYQGIVWREQ